MGCRRLWSLLLGLRSWPESSLLHAIQEGEKVKPRRKATPDDIRHMFGAHLKVVN